MHKLFTLFFILISLLIISPLFSLSHAAEIILDATPKSVNKGSQVEFRVVVPRANAEYQIAVGESKDLGGISKVLAQWTVRVTSLPDKTTACTYIQTQPLAGEALPTLSSQCTEIANDSYEARIKLDTSKLNIKRHDIVLANVLIGETINSGLTNFFYVIDPNAPQASFKIEKILKGSTVIWDMAGGGTKIAAVGDELQIHLANFVQGNSYSFGLQGENPLTTTTCSTNCIGIIKIPTGKSGPIHISVKDTNVGTIASTSPNPINIPSANNPLVTGVQVTLTQNTPTPTPIPPSPPPCKDKKITDKGCEKTDTAIGELKTDPEGFVSTVFTFLLSLSGGIAVLIFISAGYKYMTSQGNPEGVKAAQEMIVSAVTGLLFIIFSYVILQVIGSDILRIPGF